MKAQTLKRKISITGTPTWASTNGGEWTITTSGNHLVSVGDVIPFIDPYNPVFYQLTAVTGTTGSTLVLASSEQKITFPNEIFLNTFPTGFVGTTEAATFPGDKSSFQATVSTSSGNGSGVVVIQVSNEGVACMNRVTITVASAASPATEGTVFDGAWAYMRGNITSVVGTGGKMKITFVGTA